MGIAILHTQEHNFTLLLFAWIPIHHGKGITHLMKLHEIHLHIKLARSMFQL
jgi:hypothetical protein